MPATSSVNLNRLAAFAAVVESGSFTAAAEKLGLTKAMVSLHVSRLEKELGISLLTRTTRKVTPTETGAAFYADCAQVLNELESAIARVGGGSEVPAGTLRLTVAEDYGAAVVVPAIAGFMNRYPAMKVELVATEEAGGGLLRQRHGPGGLPRPHCLRLAGLPQALVSVVAQCLQQAVAPRAGAGRLGHHQRLVHQSCERLQHCLGRHGIGIAPCGAPPTGET